MPKTVLITGCSKGGIGDALVQEFHARGLRVFATARDLKKLEHLHALGVDLVQLDVSDPESIGKAVEVVKLATGGTLDFLVNNSGSGKPSNVHPVGSLLIFSKATLCRFLTQISLRPRRCSM